MSPNSLPNQFQIHAGHHNQPIKFCGKISQPRRMKIMNQKQEFHVSDYTESFEQSTQYFFGKRINLKETRLI